MDTYQAIYDATRSRIPGVDIETLAQDIVRQFDISQSVEIIRGEMSSAIWHWSRPSVFIRPKIFIDGSNWCALYGEDLQSGVAGFGKSPDLAMQNFDENWIEKAGNK